MPLGREPAGGAALSLAEGGEHGTTIFLKSGEQGAAGQRGSRSSE
jgi:hypothetical protein